MRNSAAQLVLVTGGAGFLGSALVRRLVQRGDRVRVVDDFSRGSSSRLAGLDVELQSGDVRDPAVARHACAGVDLVVHMAAINGTRHFYERPFEVLEVGILGTLNFLQAAAAAGVRRFQFFSSSEVYQKPSRVPTPEDERALIPDVLNPRYSYAGSKLAGELLVTNFARGRKLEWQIIRPHNIYGPDMGYEHVIPEVFAKLWRASEGGRTRVPSVEVQGTGEERRAFCYVDDAIDGVTLALDSDAWDRILNLGASEEVTIREVVCQIASALSIELDEIVAGPPAVGGTDRRCPDIRELSGLGYAPAVGLQAGIAKAIAWYRDDALRQPVASDRSLRRAHETAPG